MNIYSILSKDIQKKISSIFDRGRNSDVLYEIINQEITNSKDEKKVLEIFEIDELYKFLNTNVYTPKKIFEQKCKNIIVLVQEISEIKKFASIFKIFSSQKYEDSSRGYFIAPADFEGYDVFEKALICIAIKSELFAGYLMDLSIEKDLWMLRVRYKSYHDFRAVLFSINSVLIKKRDYIYAKEFCEFMTLSQVSRFISYSEKKPEDVIVGIEEVFSLLDLSEHKVLKKIIGNINSEFIKFDSNKYSKGEMQEKAFQIIRITTQKDINIFKEYLDRYGFTKYEVSFLLWEYLLKIPIEKVIKTIEFFNSKIFSKFFFYYIGNFPKEVIFTLLGGIFICLDDTEIKDFPDSLLSVVLTLLLKEKVDNQYIKRRSNLIEWMKKRSNSKMIEFYLVKILFYEYIYIHKNKEKFEQDKTISTYIDQFHKSMNFMLDQKMDEVLKKSEKDDIYETLYILVRSEMWKFAFEKFPNKQLELKELSGFAESFQIDDMLIEELAKIESEEEFTFYYENIIEKIFDNPDSIKKNIDLFRSDNWYRIYLDKARSFIVKTLIPVIGNYPCYPDMKENSAYTDGYNIFLPEYISYFKDSISKLEINRNITMYVGLALHESGHIIGGSFKFNLRKLFNEVENPMLLKEIYNIIDDFRVEKFLIRIDAHPQVEDIFISMNTYLAFNSNSLLNSPDSMFLLVILSSQAAGYYYKGIKLLPEIEEKLDSICHSENYSGRFKDIKTMSDYILNRLSNMNVFNVFESYKLSKEIYEIIKKWDSSQSDIIESYQGVKASINITGANDNRILSEEELQEMYVEFNENPKGFSEKYELPDYKSILEDEESTKSLQDSFIESIIPSKPNYTGKGTFDTAHKTKSDIMSGKSQIEKAKRDKIIRPIPNNKAENKEKEIKPKKHIVRSLNKVTNTVTLLNNCDIYTNNSVNKKFVEHNRKEYGHVTKEVYQMLAELMENNSSFSSEYSSFEGEVDMERLIEILIDKKNRVDNEFLEYSENNRKDLRIIIGLDISYSTNSKIDNESKDGARLLDVEKNFALIFADALKLITDKIEIFAFNSITSTNIYKADPLEAVSSFVADNSNRDGDFIRYINYEFSKTNEEVKYFFFLSDGQPCAENYEGEDALNDTLLAMRESRGKNVKIVYFNIDSSLDEYFYAFKEEAFYAEYFVNPMELVNKIPGLAYKIASEVI